MSAGALLEAVRGVVAEFAPEELPTFSAVGGLAPGEALRRLANGRRRGDGLEFGVGEAIVVVTPVLCAAIQQVADQAATAAADSLYARIVAWVRARRRKRTGDPAAPAAPTPRFGAAELVAVRREVVERAVRTGMHPDRAELLADSVVGRLALMAGGAAGHGPGSSAGSGVNGT